MSAADFKDANFDADAARYDRMNRTQSAEFAPGQGEGVYEAQDVMSTGVVSNNTGEMGDIFTSQVNVQSTIPGSITQPGVNQAVVQQQVQGKSDEDMFYDTMKAIGKGGFGFFKDLAQSISHLNSRWYSEWGRHVCYTAVISAVAGFALNLLKVNFGYQLLLGSLVSIGVGAPVWLMLAEKARIYPDGYSSSDGSVDVNIPLTGVQDEPEPDFGVPTDEVGSVESKQGSSDWDEWDNFEGSDWNEGDYDDTIDSDADADFEYRDSSETQEDEPKNIDDALNSLADVPKGMYERSYLYHMFAQVLQHMKPGFSTMKSISEDSDIFLQWESKLLEAAKVAGCKEDNLPVLMELQENLFTIIVTCTRPSGFKPDLVANELANIYAYRTGEKDSGVFAKVDTIGEKCKITIFNGESHMISLLDMMKQEEDFIKDPNNHIPVVLGVDQLGHVIKADFKNLESVIITGMPRKGKSWFCQAILTQMCAFVPPTELQVYICDPKEGISDYSSFCLPHVKRFESDDTAVVQLLRHLVKVEAARRRKIIGDARNVNIWDFKKRFPDVKMPVIYVVVDEIVTLASRMDKETHQEFRMLLRELISQLPALGIRAFLIPHILNNDIIEKKTSDIVPCKVSVCGGADHIEKATGSKFKDFPYKLVNKGDMAIKLDGYSDTLFVHGPALTATNDGNNEVFEYLKRAWYRLEPDELNYIDAEEAKKETAQSGVTFNYGEDEEGLSLSDIESDDDDVDLF